MANIDLTFYSGTDLYSDGDVEDDLLKIVTENDTPKKISDYLKKDNRWPIFYHLTSTRGNILSVMGINKHDSVLEIGSGCGAITGFIAEKAKHVDCIELSKKRSLINQARNHQYDNIDIHVGNFNDVVLKKKFDVILLIGVLEYGSLYMTKAENPYVVLLERVKRMLKPFGRVYIAIENKFGIKYFAGCSEDHTGKLFESIEGYHEGTARTFSNVELKDIVKKAGLNSYFYYPLPDYKLPREIYSEEFLPDLTMVRNINLSYDRDRYSIFDDELALNNIIQSGHFQTFANSFLVECRRTK